MNSPHRQDPDQPGRNQASLQAGSASDPSHSITGLERECLIQAIHDLRGPLNTTSILIDLTVAAAAKDGVALGGKLAQVVQELRRVGRMLDQLVATSDSLAPELVPLELGAAVAAATQSCQASGPGVDFRFDGLMRRPLRILSCPVRLARALELILDRCVAALPDGGEILFEANPDERHLHLVVTAKGPRVRPLANRKLRLTDGSQPAGDWFEIGALIRGIRGNLAIEPQTDLAMRIAIDLPLPHSSAKH